VEHAPDLAIHTVLVDASCTGDDLAELGEVAAAHGARLVVDDVAESPGSPRHDPRRLASAYARIFASG
jgi:aspartate aminotransferase-like enzyme